MAAEVPVVATTGGSLPEVIGTDSTCGVLVKSPCWAQCVPVCE